ncbi:N-acetyltransferase [Agreia pratensis]|uniref:GNAT family N-acetyltransferase n=1 Tax=Agreia pratensis TaxID=150121 RepID=UPI00188BDD56|nr:GNAT family N-acetyltransferase [Agreia pratensis]MBF4634487.1 N-acetyltransferase [Agreia pratensis]
MITITDTGNRYELSVDGEVVGRCFYRDAGPRRVFIHTEVDAGHAGQGLATRLIEYALTDCRTRGMRIVARCPMVSAYLGKHKDFDDLVDTPAGVDGPEDADRT